MRPNAEIAACTARVRDAHYTDIPSVHGRLPALGFHHRNRLSGSRFVAVDDRDLRALTREQQRDSLPNAGAAAGDQGAALCEFHAIS